MPCAPAPYGPRHRNGPRHRVRRGLREVLASAGMIAAATGAVLLGAGGTHALWHDDAAVAAGTIVSGSLELRLESDDADRVGDWANLVPGVPVRHEFRMTNDGSAAMAVQASAAGAPLDLEVRLVRGTCAAPLAGTDATVAVADLGLLAPGETSTVCLEATLGLGASLTLQGSALGFDTVFTATQAG